MNKYELAKKINDLDGLTNEEKSELLKLLRSQKKYGLVWEDKPENAELRMVDEMPVLEEVPERAIISDDAEAPNHVLIEGDNLEALTALSYTHTGKIDVIYIDPPYNTGNKDFSYNDRYLDSDDAYKHSTWLSFMNKRLKIAKNLLSENGVIFISIDDNEQAQLKLLCDEIFCGINFVGEVSWQRTYSIRNDSKGIPAEVEHILIYGKSTLWQPKRLPRTPEMNAAYSNPDGDVCDWMSGSPVASDAATHQGMVYAIQHPFTGKLFYPSSRAHWRYEQSQMLAYLNGWCEYKLEDLNDDAERANICGVDIANIKPHVKAIVLAEDFDTSRRKAKEVYDKGPWPRFFFTNKGKGGMRRKVYLDNVGGRIATNYWPYEETGHTDEAKKELIKIFGQAPFETPKPTRLLRRVFDLSTNQSSTILDFFAGSGTTLHATMQLNAEDGGHRKCILVQGVEKDENKKDKQICEKVTYERNRRVIQGYTTPKGEEVPGLTHNNLRYYKTKLLPRKQTIKNKRALVSASTDLLCIKNDVYTEQTYFARRKLKPSCARYFDNGKTKMLVIYNELTVDAFAETISQMEVEGKILIYVFSNTRYAYDDNFEDVLDKVELCALPAAIYDAYRNILPDENPMFEEPLDADANAEDIALDEKNAEEQSQSTIDEGQLSFEFENE